MDSILIVEDEEPIRELLTYTLDKAGYEVIACGSAEEADFIVRNQKPALIILDLMLPGMSGLDFCTALKADILFSDILIVILSALGEESHIIKGLEFGADDYVSKPFSPKLLLSRIKAVLRRRRSSLEDLDRDINLHGIFLSPTRFEARIADDYLELTATEFKILLFLLRHPGSVFTRQQIVDAIRGDDYPVTDRSVDVQIVGLRRKLGVNSSIIETVRGVGYRVRE